jgi:hypothetical protein
MADPVALAREAQEIRQRLARKKHDPNARLAEIEVELEARQREQDAEHACNRAEYVEARDEYLAAREAGWDATREYVEAIKRAALARRKMEQAGRKLGARVDENGRAERWPDPFYVQSERDPALRAIRADARDASSLARW